MSNQFVLPYQYPEDTAQAGENERYLADELNNGGHGIVTLTGTQTLTNKTFSGTVVGAGSVAALEADGHTSATGNTGVAYGIVARSTDTHAGGENRPIYSEASGGSANYSFYGADGVLYNAGDIYTVPDTAFNSSVTGFTANPPTTHQFVYRTIGKLCIVDYYFDGTGSGTTVNFTLPFKALHYTTGMIAQTKDNGAVAATGGIFDINAGSNVCTCYKPNTAAWVSTGARYVYGQVIYVTE